MDFNLQIEYTGKVESGYFIMTSKSDKLKEDFERFGDIF